MEWAGHVTGRRYPRDRDGQRNAAGEQVHRHAGSRMSGKDARPGDRPVHDKLPSADVQVAKAREGRRHLQAERGEADDRQAHEPLAGERFAARGPRIPEAVHEHEQCEHSQGGPAEVFAEFFVDDRSHDATAVSCRRVG